MDPRIALGLPVRIRRLRSSEYPVWPAKKVLPTTRPATAGLLQRQPPQPEARRWWPRGARPELSEDSYPFLTTGPGWHLVASGERGIVCLFGAVSQITSVGYRYYVRRFPRRIFLANSPSGAPARWRGWPRQGATLPNIPDYAFLAGLNEPIKAGEPRSQPHLRADPA